MQAKVEEDLLFFLSDRRILFCLLVTHRTLARLFKSTHVPPGDTLIHQGDVLYYIYFIRGGHMEILQNNESQAILSRNDILGENPCNTVIPGKSQCVVKGT